jgi:dTDP-3-amino-3,4,6-trideoxy-alpha-D-glucose transaminase
LRFHGSQDKVTFTEIGYNSRLDELQAAVLRLLLPELDGWSESRQRVAAGYAQNGLGDLLELPTLAEGGDHVYHLYVARHDRADELVASLAEGGVAARGYYRRPVHLQPAMAAYGGEDLDLPVTAEAARTNIALPMGPDLTDDAVEQVVQVCREVMA